MIREWSIRLTATILIWIAGCLPTLGQAIWFGPPSPNPHSHGAADWRDLLHQSAAWSELADHIQVFEVTAGYVMSASDNELRSMGADLARNHIGLTIGLQSIAQINGEVCGHQEGYGSPMDSIRTASRLAQLGIPLHSVGLDEPLWFGHYDPDPQACQLPVTEIARRVALNVREYQKYFPKLDVYTIEPSPGPSSRPDWSQNFQLLMGSLAAQIGKSVSSLLVDVNWRLPQYAESVHSLAAFARGEGLKFGVIYNGDGLDTTDAAWTADARLHIDELESGHGVSPDIASIQTWDAHPIRALPVDSDVTLGSLVQYYIRPQTRFVEIRSSAGIQGRLVNSSNEPIEGARINLQALGVGPSQKPTVQIVEGLVPANARFAIIGLRVNSECNCAGSNDLFIGPISYRENNASVSQIVTVPRSPPKSPGQPTVNRVIAEDSAITHLVVPPDRQFGFNSSIFNVDPGARFSFSVPLGAAGSGGLFGTVTLIWLDAERHGLFRTDLVMRQDIGKAQIVVTDVNGRFQFPHESTTSAGHRVERLEFNGDVRYRGAISYIGPLVK